MGQFGYNQLTPKTLSHYAAADATNIVTVGAGVCKNYNITTLTTANIEAFTADVWNDVIDINLGVPFQMRVQNLDTGFLKIVIGAETVGDYVRMQIEIDGVTISDVTVGPSKTQGINFIDTGLSDNTLGGGSYPVFCLSRFKVRLMKHGTIDATTSVNIGRYIYQTVQLV